MTDNNVDADLIIQQALFEGYYERMILPRPTLEELYSGYNIMGDKLLAVANEIMTQRFNTALKESLENTKRRRNPLPRVAIAYVIPLPFYLPIQDNYNAVSFYFDSPASGCYVSFFSKSFGKYKAKARLSYALVGVCSSSSYSAWRNGDEGAVNDTYYVAIGEMNRIIRSYKALPDRHNHYVHEVTRNELPSSIPYYYFDYKQRKMFNGGILVAHSLPTFDILQSDYLSDDEMKELNLLHFNTSYSDNNVIKLLVLLNSAIDAHCFGDDEKALLNINLFVEYSLGFLYMEARHIKEPSLSLELIANEYMKKSRDGHFRSINAIASIISKSDEVSIEKFKNRTGFNDFDNKYKDIRNIQMHSFFSGKVSESDSRGAIECGAKLINRVAIEVMSKATDETSVGQLSRLIEATKKCLHY